MMIETSQMGCPCSYVAIDDILRYCNPPKGWIKTVEDIHILKKVVCLICLVMLISPKPQPCSLCSMLLVSLASCWWIKDAHLQE